MCRDVSALRCSPGAKALGVLSGLIVVLMGFGGCQRDNEGLLQGYVEGEFVYVASPFGGHLVNLAVDRGQQVRPGQMLFKLDAVAEQAEAERAQRRVSEAQAKLRDAQRGLRPTEIKSIEAQLNEAQAALQLADVEWERQTKLLSSGVVSRREVDQSQALRDEERQRVLRLESVLETARLGAREDVIFAAEQNLLAEKAALAGAEWSLAQKTQLSTLDAEVTDTLCQQGDWVPAGQPVVVLLPPANLKVRVYVPQLTIGRVQVGQGAKVFVDGLREPFAAKVSFIAPRAEYTPPVIYSQKMREKFVFLVELSVAPDSVQKLHPGQPVDVRLNFSERP
jgi:HlyD family secretion protein